MKKAIIFDCDNTLWDGILGEGEVITKDIQKDIIFLANRGVIIGLCSKNNEADVLEALKTQPLTIDYISVHRINWNDKASNLREIAQELNIGLDAIVFVDDSDFEVNLIKTCLPEVLAIYPDNLMDTANNHFDLSGSFTKTQQYKENYKRVQYSKEFNDITDYLNSLDMTLTIKINDFDSINRISELTQKTNQFNLTGVRLTPFEVEVLMEEGHLIYSLSVKDKFGDNGLTGVCVIDQSKTITIFLLSCRILGRGVEFAFMDYIMNDLRERGVEYVHAFYWRFNKNIQVESFYSNLNFKWRDSICDMKIKDYKNTSKIKFNYE